MLRPVGGVYDEFEQELAAWRRRYAGRPRREMLRLSLLALEREQIVSVAYREELIARRLASMPIAQEARDIIRHALLWTWKDEEMHAIYIRGFLLGTGTAPLRLLALLHQIAGAIGGWASSMQQHVRWAEAPLARALAALLSGAGLLLGKVPRAVRRQLRYSPFRDFCLYNVDAERTASLCWTRLAELADSDDFRRIRDDEDRHRRVFAALAAALDERDRLVPGTTAEGLAREIESVGEFYLPRARRRASVAGNPLGSGGSVRVVQGATAEDKLPLFRRLLEEAGLPDRLAERARALGKPVRDLRVAVKPTFMFGYARKDPSPITDPELLEELARHLRLRQGCADVAVVEAPNIYDRFYRNRTVREVARYFGIASPHFRVVDLSEEQVPHVYLRGVGQCSVGRTWKEADFRIAFGKMRSNPVDMATLAVASLDALGARAETFFFAERQAHRETAIMMLLGDFPPHFALLDAYDSAADGLLGMMGSARPRSPRRLYAGADAVAVDVVSARHLGFEPRTSGILRAACQWFGDPAGRIEVGGVDEPIPGWRGPYHNDLSALLSLAAYPVYQFGSGRGALFVPEMDEEAFPPVAREGRLLGAGRRTLRAAFGLRHPR